MIGNEGTAGIGSTTVVANSTVSSDKQKIWKKTQERFEKLPEVNALDDSV